MSVPARFWFAPGVEIAPNTFVSNPPPHSWLMAIREPLDFSVLLNEAFSPRDVVGIQTALFELVGWKDSHHIAHYELRNKPHHGWSWTAVDGRIIAERIPASRPLSPSQET